MPAVLDIFLRAAETIDQIIAEALLGAGEILGGIHGPKEIVPGNLAIKSGDEALESIVADAGINFGFVHLNDASKFAKVRSARLVKVVRAGGGSIQAQAPHALRFHRRRSALVLQNSLHQEERLLDDRQFPRLE